MPPLREIAAVKPLGLLQLLGKALVRQFGNAVGFGVAGDVAVGVGEEVWDEWKRDKNEQQRRDELAALVQMAAQEFRRQVEEVVREVAGRQPEEVRRNVARRLEELPDNLRQSLRRPDDPSGQSVPPGTPLQQAEDLASLLSGNLRDAGPDLAPPPRITLTLANGPHKGRSVAFEERTTCVVGRGKSCYLRFPKDDHYRAISQLHCLLDINPPDIRVRDLGSLGGTYVNGSLLGRRPKGMDRNEALKQALVERDLKDGDELRLCEKGAAVFRVSITPHNQAQDVRGLGGTVQVPASDRVAIPGYTVLKELGRGGMGCVWLARQDSTGRLAAVKIMLPQVAVDERARSRFLLEMHNNRILNHPNVVRVEDYGFSPGYFFLTLEYCDGGSAARLMDQCGGVLPQEQAIHITLQALDGLDYAHNVFAPGRGLVHRDLKPANLFLSSSGSACVAKVGDYGFAKAFDDAGLSGFTHTGARAGGTAKFMARQQAIDFKYAKPEVDVWAMAASLYNMLTGAVPRDFPPGRDPLLVVLETPAVPILRRKPSLPKRLAEVIDRALVEEPEIPFKAALESAL